jgi:pimeloyl-ACP methyl ester carboxylesterase
MPASSNPERFVIDIPDSELEDLNHRLTRTRWPSDYGNEDWRYGMQREFLADFVDYWIHQYDWRAEEAAMNQFPHFKVHLGEIPIHFIHVRGNGPAPMPLILTHGWPSTFWDLRKVIQPLADPAAFGGDPADAFDVIVPSLPGFAFSTPLTVTGIDANTTADLWVQLTRDVLGYDRFGAMGFDWGDIVTQQLGTQYAHFLYGVHMTLYRRLRPTRVEPTPEEYGPDQVGAYERNRRGMEHATYRAVHNATPQTLVYAMNDSPAGMAAWLLAWRRRIGDLVHGAEDVFTFDEHITNVMLYWLTGSFSTAARFYYEYAHNPKPVPDARQLVLDVPTAIAALPDDPVAMPRRWAEEDTDLRQWTEFERGGHYAVSEVPDKYVADLRQFFRPLRET